MPIPFAAAAVPLGAKILGAAKGILAGGKMAAAAKAAAGLGKRKAGQMLSSALGNGTKQLSLNLGNAAKAGVNMADDAGMVDRIRRGLTSVDGFKKNIGIPLTKGEILASATPDLLFGGIAAATTEGDIIDKAIAGGGAAAGGIVGGLGLRGVLGPKSGMGIIGTEMIGGMLGDQVGYGAADNLIRMKHGGMTPAEQSMAQQDDAYRAQLMAELKQQYGL